MLESNYIFERATDIGSDTLESMFGFACCDGYSFE